MPTPTKTRPPAETGSSRRTWVLYGLLGVFAVLYFARPTTAAATIPYSELKQKLDERLLREDRMPLAQACFDFLPARALLDIAGWPEQDIFAHDG